MPDSSKLAQALQSFRDPADFLGANQSSDPGSSLLAQTKALPYMADKDFSYVYTPEAKGYGGMMESYPPGETGSPDAPRPEGLPLDKFGIQVIDPKSKPSDVMADYVSHYAVNSDPKLQPVYQQFLQKLDPQMMRGRYQWDVQNAGEKRPFEQWLSATGAPAMMRGYVFNQWSPDFQKQIYTPEQIQIMDQMKGVLGLQ